MRPFIRQHQIYWSTIRKAFALWAVVLLTEAYTYGACPDFHFREQLGVLEPSLVEVSGIVASRTQPGVFWAHNDSGNPSRLYAFLLRCGQPVSLGYFSLGASNIDWEDLSLGPGPQAGVDYVYLADIGNNDGYRNNHTTHALRVLRFVEPQVTIPAQLSGAPGPQLGTVAASEIDTLVFSYPGEPEELTWEYDFDAEALAVFDRIYITTKRRRTPSGSYDTIVRIYTLELFDAVWRPYSSINWAAPQKTLAQFLTVPNGITSQVTGMDISANGMLAALRTYSQGYAYRRLAEQTMEQLWSNAPNLFSLPDSQGEAIAIAADQEHVFTASENTRAFCKTSCLSNPFIRNIQVTEVDSESATVSWQTMNSTASQGVNSLGQLDWGTAIPLSESSFDLEEASSHSVLASPLTAGTVLYRISAFSEQYGDSYDCSFEFSGSLPPPPTLTPTSTPTATATPTMTATTPPAPTNTPRVPPPTATTPAGSLPPENATPTPPEIEKPEIIKLDGKVRPNQRLSLRYKLKRHNFTGTLTLRLTAVPIKKAAGKRHRVTFMRQIGPDDPEVLSASKKLRLDFALPTRTKVCLGSIGTAPACITLGRFYFSQARPR